MRARMAYHVGLRIPRAVQMPRANLIHLPAVHCISLKSLAISLDPEFLESSITGSGHNLRIVTTAFYIILHTTAQSKIRVSKSQRYELHQQMHLWQ